MSRSPRALTATALIWSLAWTAHARAEATSVDELEPVVATAPVVVDGTELFQVRGLLALPADRRAERIAGRIQAFAADAGVAPPAVRLVAEDDLTSVYGGRHLLMRVSDADAHAEGLDRKTLAGFYRERIVEAVEAYRADRQPGALGRSAVYALAATALLVAALLGLRWGSRRIDALFEQRLKSRIRDIQLQSFQLVQATQLWTVLRALVRGVQVLMWVVLLFLYLDLVLRLFPWTRTLGARLFEIVLDPLRAIGTGVLDAVPDIVFLLVLFYAVRYALKLIRLFFAALADGRIASASFEREWAWPTYRIVRLTTVALAAVIAYPYLPGSGSDAFKGVSLFLGLIISLGSTSAIANIIAGYTLSYRRAFRSGDRVKIGEHVGDIVEQRVLVTHLRTPKNEEVVIPNSMILNTEVVNYSAAARQQRLILHTKVGIGYEIPWRQVEAMLMQAAARTEGLLAEPKPFVLQTALENFAVSYELNVCCDDAQAMNQLYTRLHRSILDVFNEYGVQIMTPAYEGDPEQAKVVPKDRWFTAPASMSTRD